MTVAIDLTSLDDNFSGIERYALSITKELIKDTSLDFLLIFKNKISHFSENELSRENVKVKVLEGKRLKVLLLSLPKFLNSSLPDVALFFAFPPSPIVSLSKKIKLFCTIHDMVAFDMPKTMKWKSRLYFKIGYKKAAKRAAKIFTVSNFSKERIYHCLKVDVNDVLVTYNGFKSSNFAGKNEDRLEIALPNKYLLALSTIEPRKNFKWLISQLNRLWREEQNIPDLVIVGRKGWKTEKLLQNVHPSSLKRIHFTGFVDEKILPYIYANAACFVFPSLYEGFGVPLIESASFGCLPLSSNIPSSVEVLGNDYPYLFKIGDEKDFCDKLKEVLSLEQNQKEKTIDALKDKISIYKWETSAKQIANAIKNS